jgi:glutamate carboxypeptidase
MSIESYSQVSQALGQGEVKAVDANLRGAGDISHIAAFMQANLAGLGPVGTGAHSPQETLEVETLTSQAQRAALLLYRLTHS